ATDTGGRIRTEKAMTQFRSPSDFLRVLYKRRLLATATFILVFVYLGTISLRKTSLYEATTQVLIEQESSRASAGNAALPGSNTWYDDDFYQTQYRMLQSRALAWRT